MQNMILAKYTFGPPEKTIRVWEVKARLFWHHDRIREALHNKKYSNSTLAYFLAQKDLVENLLENLSD